MDITNFLEFWLDDLWRSLVEEIAVRTIVPPIMIATSQINVFNVRVLIVANKKRTLTQWLVCISRIKNCAN